MSHLRSTARACGAGAGGVKHCAALQRHHLPHSQHGNVGDAFAKLERMVARAAVPPKARKQYSGLAESTKAARRDFKRKRSEVKARRRGAGED